jgi:hypothetical protein
MFATPTSQGQPAIIIDDALAALEGNLALLRTVVQMVIDQSGVDLAAFARTPPPPTARHWQPRPTGSKAA